MLNLEITNPINPKTGVSVLFDKDHFTGKDRHRYQNGSEPPICITKPLKNHSDECLCLMAKGYSYSSIIGIMNDIYPAEFKNINKDTIRSYLSRCAMYYSTHLDSLIDIVGDYNFRCKDILSKLNISYGFGKSINTSKDKTDDTYFLDKNTDKVLDRIRSCFSEIHDLILTYPDKLFNLEELEKEIREQQTKIGTCRNIEDVTTYYQSIKSLYIKKAEMKALKKNKEGYKEAYIVKALKESGIDKAIKKFDKMMKNI